MLQTRNIFIDTSIFIEQNYSYRGPVFQSIVRLASNGQARVFITDITNEEVIAHIEEDVSKACQAAAKLQKDARILRNITNAPYAGLFEKIDAELAISELKNQFQTFLACPSVEVLPTTNVSIKAVFNKYFTRQPPFGEGKKKDEFPDAFVLAALEDWCTQYKERMYIVSADGDLKDHCEKSDNLLSLQKLAEFINLVEFHEKILAPSVNTLLEKNALAVEEAICKEFQNQGFWIDDQKGDVNEVDIRNIEILDQLIIEIDENTAVVQIDAGITFEANITYDDLDTATYDSEDKVLIPWRQIHKVVEQRETVETIIYIKHNVDEPNYFVIDHVEVSSENSYGFAVRSDYERPYK